MFIRSILLLFLFFFGSIQAVELSNLTVEEKVGQLLLVHFFGEEVNPDAKALIQEAHVGGIIYFRFTNTLSSPEKVQQLSAGLQKLSSIPLLIAIDQEGGILTHLKTGFTIFPGNWAVARTKNPTFAEAVAYASGEELRAVGVNMNLAPVVDVNTNPLNPVIGVRAFGTSPNEVAQFGGLALAGYKKAGIIAALKHFPGHGDVSVDSHLGLPVVNRSLRELEKTELLPFVKLSSEADVIMSAHIMLPQLDSDNCATFSQKILQGLLRKKIGFNGVIITDSLLMEGALSQAGSLEEAALRAFNAGCDILCIAGGFERKAINEAPSFLKVHRYLVAAVKEGRISRAKLDASVQRILNLKKTYGLFSAPTLPVAINTSKHQALAAEVAKQSVQLIHNTLPADFSFANTLLIATKRVADDVALTQLAQNGASTFFYKELQPTPDEIAAAVSAAQSAGTIVVLTYNGWKFTQQIELIKALLPLNKPLIALVLGTPHDTKFLPSTSAAVASFGSSPASLDAALKLLHQFKNTEE